MEQTVGVFYEFFVSFSLKLCERVYPHHFTRSMGLVAGALREGTEDDTWVPVEGTSEGVETRVRQRILLGGLIHICMD